MRSKLGKGLFVLALLGVLMVWAPARSDAQVCWRLAPFEDTIFVVLGPAAANPFGAMATLSARLRASAGPAIGLSGGAGTPYQALGAGAFTINSAPFGTGFFDMAFSFTPTTVGDAIAFGQNRICHFAARGITAAGLNGTWSVVCTGAPNNLPTLTAQGNLQLFAPLCGFEN